VRVDGGPMLDPARLGPALRALHRRQQRLPASACGTLEKATFYTANAAWLKRFQATLATFAAIVNVAMLGVSGSLAAGLLEPDFHQD